MIARLLLALLFTTTLAAQPADLVARISATPYDQELKTVVTIEIETIVPLADPEEITLLATAGGGLVVTGWSTAPGVTCEERGSVRCQLPPLPAGGKTSIAMELRSSERRANYVEVHLLWRDRGTLRVARSWRLDLYRYVHDWMVTSGADSGPGTLRQAILDANSACHFASQPCRIRFDLGEEARLFPLTPLPAVAGGELVIEGPVTIDGALLDRPANGLHITATTAVLRHVTVRGFPENGVEMTGGALVRIESSAIDGNRSRGLTVLGGHAVVTDSSLSGNARSGVFIDGGRATIARSRIENNGATGLFAARGTQFTSLYDSVIAGNAHFGVAFHGTYRDVDVARNRITGNRGGQIDIGLDGPSFFKGDVYPINGPTLHSATYDPASNTTTIRGRLDDAPFYFRLSYELHFYATMHNEADQYLGGIEILQPDFTFSVRGDHRGRFITANTIRWLQDDLHSRGTSELSRTPIEVR